MLFSIIVPIYNAEKTLVRCLDSIMAQTYQRYEVLMIDDGATDRSAEIALDYATKDNRFILLRQANAGLAAVRNRGIQVAKGEVIHFVDSDDFIESEYLQSVYEAFQRERVDIVFFGARRVSETNELIDTMHTRSLPDTYEEQLIALTRADAFGYTWLKAIKKELIREAKFDENLKPFEDEVFTCEIMKKRPAITHIDKILYNQVVVPGSLSRRTYPDYYEKCENVYLAWKQLLLSMGIPEHSVLQEKANRMAVACKYYILERDVPALSFAKKTAGCTFLKESTEGDRVVRALRGKKYGVVLAANIIYRGKNYIRKWMRR